MSVRVWHTHSLNRLGNPHIVRVRACRGHRVHVPGLGPLPLFVAVLPLSNARS